MQSLCFAVLLVYWIQHQDLIPSEEAASQMGSES